MSLTERDESDLVGLASELGNPDSDARGRRLMQTNPEAAEFFRQITSVYRALQAHGEVSSPPLSAEETDVLASTISARAERARAGRRLALRHPWRWGGVAAAIVVAAATWFSSNQYTRPVVAEAIFIPISTNLNHQGATEHHRAQVRAGQPVETRDECAVLKLTDDSRMVVAQSTRLVFQRTGPTIELQKGTLFIQATTAVRVRVGDMLISLGEAGSTVMVKTTPNEPVCRVYAGRAKLIRQGRDTQLSGGQEGAWDNVAEGVHITALSTGLPTWVKNALDLAARP